MTPSPPPLLVARYRTPPGFDDLLMASSDGGATLTALHFDRSPAAPPLPSPAAPPAGVPAFRETRRWLDLYFSGRPPAFTPPFRIENPTPFRRDVLQALLAIPWGAVTTYGAIAAGLAARRGIPKMSAQAVGQAVGWNPVCLIVPCHRVVGTGGAPVGYGGGLPNKLALLALERAPFECHRRQSTALAHPSPPPHGSPPTKQPCRANRKIPQRGACKPQRTR